MKKSIFKILTVMFLMVFLLASCGGGTTSESGSAETASETSEESAAAENVLAGKTYEYVNMQIDGKEVDIPEELKGRKCTFNDDYTFLLTGYRSESGGYTLKDMTGKYTIEGDNVTMIIDWDPNSMVFDDEELNASSEDMEETPEEDRTDHAVINGDDLNFSMDFPKYDEEGNETGETELHTWTYSLVK